MSDAIFAATATVDGAVLESLTAEQRARLEHHIEISRRVFQASVDGMLKGVQKYPAEPTSAPAILEGQTTCEYWLPHIFIEAVDGVNQTGLFADALGVEL